MIWLVPILVYDNLITLRYSVHVLAMGGGTGLGSGVRLPPTPSDRAPSKNLWSDHAPQNSIKTRQYEVYDVIEFYADTKCAESTLELEVVNKFRCGSKSLSKVWSCHSIEYQAWFCWSMVVFSNFRGIHNFHFFRWSMVVSQIFVEHGHFHFFSVEHGRFSNFSMERGHCSPRVLWAAGCIQRLKLLFHRHLAIPGFPQSDHTVIKLSADTGLPWNTVKQASRPQFIVKTQSPICLDYRACNRSQLLMKPNYL